MPAPQHPDQVDLAALRASFAVDGVARLPVRMPTAQRLAMTARIDQLMRGDVVIDGLFFQHDSVDGRYETLLYARGWIGPSMAYRKLEKLERDPLVRAWIEAPVLEPIVRALVPGAASGAVPLYRAVLWNKVAGGGTALPWHQDGGAFWGVTPAPVLTLWTALDDAPLEAGCVEIIQGSQRAGLATAQGGVVPPDVVAMQAVPSTSLPAVAGEVIALHNHAWHRSGTNSTSVPRRALSVCYLSPDARCTRTRRAPRTFVSLFAGTLGAAAGLT